MRTAQCLAVALATTALASWLTPAGARDVPYNPPPPAEVAASATGTADPAAPAASAPAAGEASAGPAAPTARELEARRRELRRWQSVDLGLMNPTPAQAYLDGLVARIQAAGPQPARFAQVVVRPRLSYSAFSAPQGYIVIDLGWLLSIDSEAELIALLAHEYGHIVADDWGSKRDVGVATQTAVAAARLLTARTGGSYVTTNLVSGGWTDMLMPSWGRQQELAADRFAVDISQRLQQPYVSGMRAFLERIRSVEQDVQRRAQTQVKPGSSPTAPPPPAPGTGSDDHPSIDERLERAQALVEGLPRIRTAKGPDPWRTLRDSPAFKQGLEETMLAVPAYEAFKRNDTGQLRQLAQRLAQRPAPLRTAAALTMVAVAFPRPEPGGSLSLLQSAMAAPDVSMLPFYVMAMSQREVFKDYEGAFKTLDAGMDRFEQPAVQLPDFLEFQRTVLERIDAIPQQQRGGLGFLALKRQFLQLSAKARCMTEAELREACSWADMNERQRQQKLQQDKAKFDALTRKLEQQVQKAMH